MALKALIAFNILIIASAMFMDIAPISAENSLIETMQVLLCACAAALFGFAATATRGPLRTASIMLFSVMLIALYREIDFRTMPGTKALHLLSESWFRDTMVGVMLLGVLVYAFTKRHHVLGWIALLFRRTSLPLWLGGSALVLSIAFDVAIRFEGSRLVEEMIELNGFLLLVMAAYITAHQSIETVEHQSQAAPQNHVAPSRAEIIDAALHALRGTATHPKSSPELSAKAKSVPEKSTSEKSTPANATRPHSPLDSQRQIASRSTNVSLAGREREQQAARDEL